MTMTMNSKHRVRAVLEGTMPDRTPLGFFAIDSDTAGQILGRETYWRAKGKSQIAFWQGRRDEVVQSWIEDGIELYRKLDFIDIIPVCCESAGICPPKGYKPDPPKQIDEATWESSDGKIYRYSPITKDITIIKNPPVKSGSIDLASQNGPMLNPQMYRELFLEGFTKRIASAKSLGQRVIKHMCGNNWPLLDIMVEAGIDCYQSVQQSAGMDIAEVQVKYKDKFVVWGGLPVEYLIEGSMEDVRNAVQKVMAEVAPHGRFIFGTSHSVAVGTKYENFMTMLDQFNKML